MFKCLFAKIFSLTSIFNRHHYVYHEEYITQLDQSEKTWRHMPPLPTTFKIHPNISSFMPFYAAPAKRFDFGYGPRSRLSGFL